VSGKLPLFSSVEHGKPIGRPCTILVDSLQFESGEGLSAEFKKIASIEIEEFRADYARRVPGRKAEEITRDQLHIGEDLRANRLPRHPRWCSTCADCGLLDLCRNRE
jgi:hypothetical protein